MAEEVDSASQEQHPPAEPVAETPEAPAAPEAAPTEAPAKPKAAKPDAPAKPKAARPDAPAKPKAAKPDAPAEPKAATPDAPAEPEVATPAEPEEPAPIPEQSAPSVPAGAHYFWGTGRRKKAVARVRIRPGTGKILMNKKELDQYFTQDKDRSCVLAPLQCVRMVKAWDIWANIKGGGFTGQAGAVKLGLARALIVAMPDNEHALRAQGLLTRDARMVERKKPGQKGARKRFQFSKR